MMWEKVKLGDIASFSNGINFNKTAYEKGVKLIGVSNFGDRFYPDYLQLQEVKKDIVRPEDCLRNGDIVFVRSNGNKELVGRCMLVKNPTERVTYSGFCIRARLNDTDRYDPVYFTYYFKSKAFRRAVSGTAVGANIQNLSQARLSNHDCNVPDIETQHRIADILSAYDDLIENNQKQIKLLEEADQRFYKEWFVDLRFPGHENTKIVDGVPEGWRVASIADICDTVGGGTPSTKIQSYYEKGDILWVTPTDITRNFSLALLDTEKKITPEGLKNSSAKMLPAETILMTSRASVGFFGMCKYEVCTNQGFISCIPKRENLQMYLLFNLKSRVEEIRQKAGGSTYLEISKTVFRELKIILPKDEVLAEYQKNVHDIFDEIYCRTEMIKSLVDMRNRLLPKLMSGEVEV